MCYSSEVVALSPFDDSPDKIMPNLHRFATIWKSFEFVFRLYFGHDSNVSRNTATRGGWIFQFTLIQYVRVSDFSFICSSGLDTTTKSNDRQRKPRFRRRPRSRPLPWYRYVVRLPPSEAFTLAINVRFTTFYLRHAVHNSTGRYTTPKWLRFRLFLSFRPIVNGRLRTYFWTPNEKSPKNEKKIVIGSPRLWWLAGNRF